MVSSFLRNTNKSTFTHFYTSQIQHDQEAMLLLCFAPPYLICPILSPSLIESTLGLGTKTPYGYGTGQTSLTLTRPKYFYCSKESQNAHLFVAAWNQSVSSTHMNNDWRRKSWVVLVVLKAAEKRCGVWSKSGK